MSPDQLKERLQALDFSAKAFATRVGSNERTVRRWISGEQGVPAWVNVILHLMKDAQDRGHGEFYAAWNKAVGTAQDAFTEWLSRENPPREDIVIEVEFITRELCKAGKIDRNDLDLLRGIASD